ncbi:MAG TPA: hypothetical protein VGF45_17450 [Polyangia bacterium]
MENKHQEISQVIDTAPASDEQASELTPVPDDQLEKSSGGWTWGSPNNPPVGSSTSPNGGGISHGGGGGGISHGGGGGGAGMGGGRSAGRSW